MAEPADKLRLVEGISCHFPWSPPLWFTMVAFAVVVVLAGVDHITGLGTAAVVVGVTGNQLRYGGTTHPG